MRLAGIAGWMDGWYSVNYNDFEMIAIDSNGDGSSFESF